MSTKDVAVVVGAGPGLGAALARRFAKGGFRVALMARRQETLGPLQGELAGSIAVAVDASDEAAMRQAFERVRAELGDPSVLLYNAGAFVMGGVLDVDAATFEQAWKATCLGGFLASKEVLPAMVKKGCGTILFTGATAALRGSARFSCLAVGKFGLRALAQSMARELGPEGIHVAHVIIDGLIDTARVRSMVGDREAGTMLEPDAIAETYWQLHVQDRSAWTQEMDLRPSVEKF